MQLRARGAIGGPLERSTTCRSLVVLYSVIHVITVLQLVYHQTGTYNRDSAYVKKIGVHYILKKKRDLLYKNIM